MMSRHPKQIAAAEAQVRQGTRQLEAAEEMRPDHAIQYPLSCYGWWSTMEEHWF